MNQKEIKKKVDESWKEKAKTTQPSSGEDLSQKKDEELKPQEADFSIFVVGLNMQAMILLGEVASPLTGKTEENLDQAKYIIDTISLLKDKTKGNLTKEEDALIDEILYGLRMRYASRVTQEGK